MSFKIDSLSFTYFACEQRISMTDRQLHSQHRIQLSATGTRKAISELDLARINVIGTSGSGKSTLALKLAEKLKSRYIELDRLFWNPNWQPVELDIFKQRVADEIAKEPGRPDRWILDGNYSSKTEAIKWARATTVIWLDYSFGRTLKQATSRAFQRAWQQTEIWPGTGNRESFSKLFFSHDSIVLWTLISYHKVRRRYAAKMSSEQFAHIDFVRLQNPRQTAAFLGSIASPTEPQAIEHTPTP